MQVRLATLVAAFAGNHPWEDAYGRRRYGRRRRDRDQLHLGVGVDAPSLDSRWVVLVEDGKAIAPPRPCLFDENLAWLEAESAIGGAREGVTARVGTMRLLLSLDLGLRAEHFRAPASQKSQGAVASSGS